MRGVSQFASSKSTREKPYPFVVSFGRLKFSIMLLVVHITLSGGIIRKPFKDIIFEFVIPRYGISNFDLYISDLHPYPLQKQPMFNTQKIAFRLRMIKSIHTQDVFGASVTFIQPYCVLRYLVSHTSSDCI
jgi:hypothetical protein